MKIFCVLLIIFLPLWIIAQPNSDLVQATSKKKIRDIEVSLVKGYYGIKETDSGLYRAKGFYPTLGISYRCLISEKIWGQITASYTNRKFSFTKFDQSANYLESPVMLKEIAYLDIGAFIGYDLIIVNKVKSYLTIGYFQGSLVKGMNIFKGIYGSNYGTEFQFNRGQSSLLAGIGFRYYFKSHLCINSQINYRYYRMPIEKNGSNKTQILNIVLGFCYTI